MAALRSALAAAAVPAQAGAMQAYMKSALPFHGVAAPVRRRAVAAVVREHPVADAQSLIDTVLPLWRGATQREERYAALDLLRQPRHQKWIDLALLPVLLYDCILPSVGDSAMAKEFFNRKGMGWALRERSYAAPDEVRAFCSEYRGQLSPLTLREALRVID